MTYAKPTHLGWLVWWDPLPALTVHKLRDTCARYNVALTITLPDPLAKGALVSAIRTVFPDHDVVQVGNGPKYRRFQISRRVTNKSVCQWDTVDFVRVFSSGRVICERRRDAETHLIGVLKKSTKQVTGATVNKVFGQFIENSTDAVPIGSAYLVPKKPDKKLRAFYMSLQTDATKLNMIYIIPLWRHRDVIGSMGLGVTRYLAAELNAAVKQGKKTGNYRTAVREKHRIKRMAQRIERALEAPLYGFRSVLAQTVLDNPAMQDTDEWRSRW